MTRSIRWISSSEPPSPFSMACAALPQPRSRMELAAAMRAGAAALVLRMTPTSTLSAVRVWLRAGERISVTDLGILNLCLINIGARAGIAVGRQSRDARADHSRLRAGIDEMAFFAGPNIFAGRRVESCCVNMIHGEVVRPDRRPKCRGSVVGPASAVFARDELDDLGTHENPSHNANAIRPASASEIKYAVIPACPSARAFPDTGWLPGSTPHTASNGDGLTSMRGMTARGRSFQALTLSLSREAACWRVRARRQNLNRGSDGGAHQGALRPALRYEIGAPRGHRPMGEARMKKPAAGFPARAQCLILAMLRICW